MAVDPTNEYPKHVSVDGVTLVARNKEHEESLLAGKGDPQIAEAQQARLDAAATEAQKVADEAAQKAKDAKDAAKAKPAAPAKKEK